MEYVIIGFKIILYVVIVLLILIILYLLAIMPKLLNRKDMTYWTGKYFAHRGLHNNVDVPENSYLAFSLAVENNYGIELDLHLTRDNVPVVFHDKSLLRMCGVDLRIEDLTLEALSKHTLLDTKETIPTFEEILNLVNCKVPLIVEFKIKRTDTSLCYYTQKLLDNYQGPYCIESFNPLPLIWYKKNYPKVVRGQLSSHFLKESNSNPFIWNFLLQNLLFNFITKPDFIAFNHASPKLLAISLCRLLYKTPILAWTISSIDDLEDANKYFQSYIFEGFIPNEKID